jgi:hypothetical protein
LPLSHEFQVLTLIFLNYAEDSCEVLWQIDGTTIGRVVTCGD